MRRILAAIILTVAALTVSLTGRLLTDDSITYIQQSMSEIDSLLSENKTHEALQTCGSFLQEWENHHGRLCMFLQHEHLDPLENIFAVLPFYIEQGETVLARAECRTAISLTEHIDKTERISFENIL